MPCCAHWKPASRRISVSPERTVAVVGGGIVGLSCAWHLQRHGISVVLFERDHVGAGASWGNAGYAAPALAVPLPEPAAVRAGLRSLIDPRSPVLLPKLPGRELTRFLVGFLAHSSHRRWSAGLRALLPLNVRALAEYDYLAANGVPVEAVPAPFIAVLRNAHEGAGLLAELAGAVAAGFPVDYDLLTGAEVREVEPLAAGAQLAIRLRGQRMLNPPRLVDALAESVRTRGAEIHEGTAVTQIARRNGKVELSTVDGMRDVDAVVLAAGAWLPRLAREHGVRVPMHPGRGYSFSVRTPTLPSGMLNFPGPRIACAPIGDRLRVTSLMELWPADRPPPTGCRCSARPAPKGSTWPAGTACGESRSARSVAGWWPISSPASPPIPRWPRSTPAADAFPSVIMKLTSAL